MKISPEQVESIALLSRLELPREKVELFAEQLSDVLGYMVLLEELDTSDVAPLYSPSEHAAPTRADEVVREFDREEILANAPEDDGRFFIVPKIV